MSARRLWAVLLWSVVTVASYIGLAVLSYWIFYSYEPYNEETGEGATAFKAWFTIAFSAHVLLTMGLSSLFAHVVRLRLWPLLAISAIIVAAFGMATLVVLAAGNACQGLSFPWESRCPT